MGKFRIEFDRASVVGNGPVNVAFAPLGDAAVVIGEGVFRIEFDGAGVVSDGLI